VRRRVGPGRGGGVARGRRRGVGRRVGGGGGCTRVWLEHAAEVEVVHAARNRLGRLLLLVLACGVLMRVCELSESVRARDRGRTCMHSHAYMGLRMNTQPHTGHAAQQHEKVIHPPCPSCPWLAQPQVNKSPWSLIAAEWLPPQAMSTNSTLSLPPPASVGVSTRPGVWSSFPPDVTRPSCDSVLAPWGGRKKKKGRVGLGWAVLGGGFDFFFLSVARRAAELSGTIQFHARK
jgi:hypothetical protein